MEKGFSIKGEGRESIDQRSSRSKWCYPIATMYDSHASAHERENDAQTEGHLGAFSLV
jgi:hypothetical protein